MHLRLALGLLVLSSVSCISRGKKPEVARQEDRQHIETELSQEMSLKQDREELQDMRKDVPPETQKSNDELALFLNLMKQGTEQPAVVRDRFTSLVQKKRTSFREKVDRLRTDFRTEETRRREDFLSAQRNKRESFLSGKRAPKDVQRFSADQDKDRSRFFADERDRRQNFESELSAKSKDFESYMREKMNEFNEQYRLYSKKFSEIPKEKKAVTGDDFKRMDSMPAKTLGTEE